MLYASCRELPLHVFNEILVIEDLGLLVKEQPPEGQAYSVEQLTEQWQKILDEYSELSKDQASKKVYRDKAEILFLEQKLNALRIIFVLGQLPKDEKQTQEYLDLRKKFKVKDIKKDMTSTENLLRLKIEDFKRMNANESNPNSFEYNLAKVGEILGFQINRFTTTVSEWINLLKVADEKVRAEQRTREKKKGR